MDVQIHNLKRSNREKLLLLARKFLSASKFKMYSSAWIQDQDINSDNTFEIDNEDFHAASLNLWYENRNLYPYSNFSRNEYDIYNEEHTISLFHKIVKDKNTKLFSEIITNSSIIKRGLKNYINTDHQKKLIEQFNSIEFTDQKKAEKLLSRCHLSTIMYHGNTDLLTIALDFICEDDPGSLLNWQGEKLLQSGVDIPQKDSNSFKGVCYCLIILTCQYF